MKNLHKNPFTWTALAAGVFGIGLTFAQTHCSITSGDLITLVVSAFTFVSGYLHGKGNASTVTPN